LEAVNAPFAVLLDGKRGVRRVGTTTLTVTAALAFARAQPASRPTVYALDPDPLRPAWRWQRVRGVWSSGTGVVNRR